MKRILIIGFLVGALASPLYAGPTKEAERLLGEGRLREAEAAVAKALKASPKSVDLLTLSVVMTDSNTVVGTFLLTRGRSPNVVKCL